MTMSAFFTTIILIVLAIEYVIAIPFCKDAERQHRRHEMRQAIRDERLKRGY